jgi:hypothetical protein
MKSTTPGYEGKSDLSGSVGKSPGVYNQEDNRSKVSGSSRHHAPARSREAKLNTVSTTSFHRLLEALSILGHPELVLTKLDFVSSEGEGLERDICPGTFAVDFLTVEGLPAHQRFGFGA